MTFPGKERQEQWAQRLQQQQISGIAQRTWCKQEGIKYDQFQYWKKRIKKLNGKANQEPESDPSQHTTSPVPLGWKYREHYQQLQPAKP